MAKRMERSWLIQRLTRPHDRDNPFSFGGGLRNGGLSPDAMELLRPLMGFDYMGAAEFEFGAVPEAFRAIAEQSSEYEPFTVEIPLSEIERDWRFAHDPRNAKAKKPAPEAGSATVYVFCNRAHRAEAEGRIRAIALDEYKLLKETTRLAGAIRNKEPRPRDVVGWLELDNAFFFAVDKVMFDGVVALFSTRAAGTGTAEKRECV